MNSINNFREQSNFHPYVDHLQTNATEMGEKSANSWEIFHGSSNSQQNMEEKS